MVVLANPIVSIAFGRGVFTLKSNCYCSSNAILLYQCHFIRWRQIMEKVFYAMEDTKTPMMNAVISIVD